APGSTCTLNGEVGPEEWLRRHWRNALDNWMFWHDAYQRDIGEPDAPFPWQSWRVSAERAKADAARWRVIARDLAWALTGHRHTSQQERALAAYDAAVAREQNPARPRDLVAHHDVAH